MKNSYLFIDGSVNNRSKCGYGAYLLIDKNDYREDLLSEVIRIKKFKNTSSAKLELETLLWALEDISLSQGKITIYTDSQNIVSLKTRREKITANKTLNLSSLYQKFFKATDRLNCEIIKIKGHRKTENKTDPEKYFTLVDRASRKAMRKEEKNF